MSLSVEQAARRNPERLGQLLNHGCGGVAGAALDVADIGAMDPGLERIVLLAELLCEPQAANVGTKALADIHGAGGAAL